MSLSAIAQYAESLLGLMELLLSLRKKNCSNGTEALIKSQRGINPRASGKHCGSTLPGPNDNQHMYIPAGLITQGGDSLKVAHHIFVESKACWDVIGDGGKIHRGAFGK